MKVVRDKFEKNSTGLVGVDIGFRTAKFPSQSDIENYVTRGRIDFRSTLHTLPKDVTIKHFKKAY